MIGCTDMQTQQTNSEYLAHSNNIVLLVAYRFVHFYGLLDQRINFFLMCYQGFDSFLSLEIKFFITYHH